MQLDKKTAALYLGGQTKIVHRTITPTNLPYVYTPGVAKVVQHLIANPADVIKYTNVGSRVLIITDGSAALGYGEVAPTATKPIMEAKAAIYKQVANLDAIDLIYDVGSFKDPAAAAASICQFARNSFAAIHLEDIKAPVALDLYSALTAHHPVVIHDDRHATGLAVLTELMGCMGTAINWADLNVVLVGAGPAALGVYELLVHLGNVPKVYDQSGPLKLTHTPWKLAHFKKAIAANYGPDLASDLASADVIIGLSRPDVGANWLKGLPAGKLGFFLANPTPEVPFKTLIAHQAHGTWRVGGHHHPDLPVVNNSAYYPYLTQALIREQGLPTPAKLVSYATLLASRLPKNQTGYRLVDQLVTSL